MPFNFCNSIFFDFMAMMINMSFYLPLWDKISAYGSDLCGTVDKISYINARVCSGIGVHDDYLIEKLAICCFLCSPTLSLTTTTTTATTTFAAADDDDDETESDLDILTSTHDSIDVTIIQ